MRSVMKSASGGKQIQIFKIIAQRRLVFISSLAIIVLIVGVIILGYSLKNARHSKAGISCTDSVPQTCIFKDMASNTDISGITWDNTNLIIDNATVTIFGAHTFESLTVRNNGLLTHAPLTAGSDYIYPSYQLIAGAADKKIDINVKNTIKLESGGEISADATGYEGGNPLDAPQDADDCNALDDCKNGHGPSGGGNGSSHDDNTGGGGGSYGGKGGSGYVLHSFSRDTYGAFASFTDYQNTPLELLYGSGGGGARRHAYSGNNRIGGQGGGRIFITAGDLIFDSDSRSRISANGENGEHISSDDLVAGGGGSGGSIVIRLTKYSGQTVFTTNAVVTGGTGCGIYTCTSAADGSFIGRGVNVNNTDAISHVAAKGGSGDTWAGGGGGGRIYIEAIQTQVSILKSITRGDGLPLYSFKPNDVVAVILQVSNLTVGQAVDIKDEIFTDGINNPIVSNISDGGTLDGSYVHWNAFVPTATTATLSYGLTIK